MLALLQISLELGMQRRFTLTHLSSVTRGAQACSQSIRESLCSPHCHHLHRPRTLPDTVCGPAPPLCNSALFWDCVSEVGFGKEKLGGDDEVTFGGRFLGEGRAWDPRILLP